MHSDVDADPMHVRLADESVCIGSPTQNSYLNISSIKPAVDLTEQKHILVMDFYLKMPPEIVNKHGIKFIGPSAKITQKWVTRLKLNE